MPAGRIILKTISTSKKLATLKTDGARLLYTWLIPHLDINGCYSGDPVVIAGRVLTRLRKSIDTVSGYLDDLEKVGLIIRYEAKGDCFLIVPDFVAKQPNLNPSREGKATIPTPTPDQLRSNSGVTQSQVKESKVNIVHFREDFDKAWRVYPRKEGKEAAFCAYKARRKEKVSSQDLLEATKKFAVRMEAEGRETKHIKLGATFYGPKKYWEEELVLKQTRESITAPQCMTMAEVEAWHRGEF